MTRLLSLIYTIFMGIDFLEIESKYKATGIKLNDLVECLKPLGPYRLLSVSSHDHYYVSGGTNFIRFRESPSSPELTIKQKHKDTNNFVRTEVNLKIDANENIATVARFCELLGYKHNFTIFKNCSIYFFDTYNLVFYVVFDSNMQELGRFIEIEMSETHPWESKEKCWEALVTIEKTLAPIGITAANRIRRSLFEMFRKDLND